MESSDTTLSTHIEELRARLDRLSHVGDMPHDEAAYAVEDAHSIAAIRQIPALETHIEPAETLQVRRAVATSVDRLLSSVIGPFCRCPYCGTWGARRERGADRRRWWRCRCCLHRRR